jgi:hypothetical protein
MWVHRKGRTNVAGTLSVANRADIVVFVFVVVLGIMVYDDADGRMLRGRH